LALSEKLVALHRHVADPERRGAGLAVCRALLSVPTLAYGAVMRLRDLAYERGWKGVAHVPVAVVSVGNITAGGTGKTPFTAWVVRLLLGAGRRPAVLSRGYGADARSGLDDENETLRRLIPEVPIVVDPDRVRGAGRACREDGADVLVLDDGFQHRRLARDLDIVLIDALQPFGGGHLLPRGLLREPLTSLSRAGALVVTRSDQVSGGRLRAIRDRLAALAPAAPLALAVHRPVSVRAVGAAVDEAVPFSLEELEGERWGAFCGIGNPLAFRLTLEQMGVEVAFFRAFPDHHAYSPAEVARVVAGAVEAGCMGLITTEKDAVKLERSFRESLPVPLLVLHAEIEVVEGREGLEDALLAAMR